jgi:thiamine pyrophosphate-dependent acetolactate synthase large subunit-like protein
MTNVERDVTAPPALAPLAPAEWGSDVVAGVLRALDIPYAALVPGASFRGLHDSMVNYLADTQPTMLLCLHEEHAVAIAHGYAKVTAIPMLAIVHSNVGLMHASMAVFNAWCDRVPVLMLGANGPVDAARRRPWIDWIHTSQDMGALVRPYTKWDDQPGSPRAAVESILRAYQIAATAPQGPTYVCLDTELQEEHLEKPVPIPAVGKFAPPHRPAPAPEDITRVLELLRAAKAPVIIAGRCSRSIESWNQRVALAETFNARVITQYKIGAMFPTEHPLHAGQSGGPRATEAIREADLIIDLDALDIAGIIKQASRGSTLNATLVSCSVDRYVHNGWSMDYQALPALDLNIATSPDELVSALVAAIGSPKPAAVSAQRSVTVPTEMASDTGEIGIDAFAHITGAALHDEETCYTRLPLGVDEKHFVFRHPLDYLGGDGGGGVGGGTGIGVGAALALRGTSRLPVCITGDGDYLMGVTALWTAVHSKIPILVIVANNRSYFNDEVHQERMAKVRDRPVERKWIGQRLDDPAPDLAGFARAQGAIGIGPITRPSDIPAAIAEGVKLARDGNVVVIDVIVRPEYAPGVAAGVTSAMHAPTRGGGAERGD